MFRRDQHGHVSQNTVRPAGRIHGFRAADTSYARFVKSAFGYDPYDSEETDRSKKEVAIVYSHIADDFKTAQGDLFPETSTPG